MPSPQTSVRIANVSIPVNKNICISLGYIYGVGVSLAKKICLTLNIDINKKVFQLEDLEVKALRDYIEKNLKVEDELRRKEIQDIKNHIAMGNYRGYRHRKGLPVRGQNTKNNARTRKGKKKSTKSVKK
jgi:small subunit ribosomal protein S13